MHHLKINLGGQFKAAPEIDGEIARPFTCLCHGLFSAAEDGQHRPTATLPMPLA